MRQTTQGRYVAGRYVVVGGGITGLLAAWRVRRERPDVDVVVLEASERAGGVLATAGENGFLVEQAASTFRAGARDVLDAVRELGLEGELVESAASARKKWILRHGELVSVPSSPLSLAKSRLLSGRGKLRLLKEPWVARGGDEEETLAAFVARRFGGELVDPLLDAIVTGIFAGDPRRIEARSAFPRIAELEARHGSVLRGLWRERARGRERPSCSRTRTRGVLALRGGMQQLVDRLTSELGDVVKTRKSVVKLDRGEAGWTVACADGSSFDADSLFLSTPSWISARLLAPLDLDLARELAAIDTANVAVVGIGVPRDAIGADVDGLGFLVPGSEGTPLLGVLYESSLFPHRAPDGHVLLRAMVGGERTRFPDDERAVAKLAWLETSRVLRISGAPRFLRAFLHRPGIPQYRPGHGARMKRIAGRLAALPGLELAGWSYRGISLDDRARESRRLAELAAAAPQQTGVQSRACADAGPGSRSESPPSLLSPRRGS